MEVVHNKDSTLSIGYKWIQGVPSVGIRQRAASLVQDVPCRSLSLPAGDLVDDGLLQKLNVVFLRSVGVPPSGSIPS